MTTELRVSRTEKGRTRLELVVDGRPVARASGELCDERSISRAARRLGVSAEDVHAAVAAAGAGEKAVPVATGFVVRVRGLLEPSDHALEFCGESPLQAVDKALSAEGLGCEEPVVAWDGQDRLSALDLDAQAGYGFDDASLLALLGSFSPVPAFAWTTRSGGLRMLYTDCPPFRAEEVAVVALLELAETVPHRAIELKSNTRHPWYPDGEGRRCGIVVRKQQSFDPAVLRSRLRVPSHDAPDASEWLESRDFAVGRRYPHSRCPVEPSDSAKGDPVAVGEHGVFCFVCEAHGVCHGSSRPGFFPYAAFVGGGSAGDAYRCFEKRTHWEHASFVLRERLGLSGRYAKLAYSAGLLLFGADRAVSDACFAAGRDVVRMDRRWTNLRGEPYTKDLRQLLSTLPAVGDESGVDRALLAKFQQGFDLGNDGYPSLHPVFGCRIYTQRLKLADERILVVVQRSEYCGEGSARFAPKYAPEADRMPLAEARAVVEQACPAVYWPYLELLVAAKGCVEGGVGLPPMVFAVGPTGASKTGTVHLAACVCGDRCGEIVWTRNSDRVRQAIVDEKQGGTFVAFNEPFKEASRSGGDAASAVDFLLNLTPESTSWVAYVGPVRMGRLPVFVWTDTTLPDEVRRHAQIGRRVVHVRLPSEVDWEKSVQRAGADRIGNLRSTSERMSAAMDSVLGSVVDRFFSEPMTFADIATALGFRLLRDTDEAAEGRELLRDFFAAVCAAPELVGSDATRWKGRGWKLVAREVEGPLRDLWLGLCDGEEFASSRRCAETDWRQAAGLVEPARLEVRAHSTTRVVMRFRSEAGTRVEYRVNEELCTPT